MIFVFTIGAIIATAIYRTLGAQQGLYREQKIAIAQHDALRLAGTILMTSLLEASGSDGDFNFLEDDSVGVRSPVGFAVVCSKDDGSRTIGLFDLHGRVGTTASDSLLVYTNSGWVVRGVEEENPSSPSLSCPYSSGPTIQKTLRVDDSVDDIPIGAPIRAFHNYTYRLDRDGSEWWLARDDGTAPELLAGPFNGDGSGLSFTYLDSLGAATTDPAAVRRVDLMLVTAVQPPSDRVDSLTLSASMRNQN